MPDLTPEQTEVRRRSGRVSAQRWNKRNRDTAARAAGYGLLMGGDTDCVHHWLLPQPDGRASLGRCRKCGGTMWMQNSVGDGSWKERGEVTKMLADEFNRKPL